LDGLYTRLNTRVGTDDVPLRADGNSDHLLDAKHKTNIGCWNVRTMYEVSKAAQVGCVMKQYSIEILGLSETIWTGNGKVKMSIGETIIYSSLPNSDAKHIKGVGIMMSERSVKTLRE
jgi:hypothetical protein